MSFKIGTTAINKAYLGEIEIKKAYLGASVVYDKTAWTPAELGADLALWLDADDVSTITLNGSNVAQWDDKSGNNRHAVQATASNQPAYSATEFNGMPAVVWPNSANTVRMDTVPFAAQSFFFVLRYHNGTQANWISAYQGVFSLPSSSSTTGSIGLVSNNVNGNQWLNTNIFNNGRYNGDPQVNLNSRITLPLPQTILEASAETPRTPVFSYQIGCDRNSSGRGWSGPIAEIIATPALLSDADRQKLEGYLAWKWGGI